MFGRKTPAEPRTAIIDIGSNSIRLVVYQGHPRLPAILFNEKVMAGLGRSLATTGAIDRSSFKAAVAGLARFAAVAREMEAEVRTVATAAVRDATNGPALVAAAEQLGLKVELLSGEQEAVAAGQGVISALPEADGIVGDLGGGSLELVRVVAGRGKAFERHVTRLIRDSGWAGRGKGLPVYMVGGSWRALARLDMTISDYPLPIIHGYTLSAATVTRLGRVIAHLTKPRLRAISGLSSARASTLGDAAALLAVLLRELSSTTAIASSFGLREGLLYGALDTQTRALDPLIVGAREEGRLLGRFPEHGDLLDRWIAPLFDTEPAAQARIRHAACLLADVGWHANPEFRAERGVEIALHGNWVAIDAAERAMLAQALHVSLGGSVVPPAAIASLADAAMIETANRWGLAIRLGQRLSGGIAAPLKRSRLVSGDGAVTLYLEAADRALYGDAVERRHSALAVRMGVVARLG